MVTILDATFTRSLQKKKKKARHEEEKQLMESMRAAGCEVGVYVGNGQGETDTHMEELTSVHLDGDNPSPSDDELPGEVDDGCGDDCVPLFILYDCESTGFSIYSDHITDIAAMVLHPPVPLNEPTFSSLVRTSRHIPAKGM